MQTAPQVSLDGAVLFTESFRDCENKPSVVRWPEALQSFEVKSPMMIFPNELIVGLPNAWHGSCPFYPMRDSAIMVAGVDTSRQRPDCCEREG